MKLAFVLMIISSHAHGGNFGTYSWTDVANCQSYLRVDASGRGEICKKWISLLIENSPQKTAKICKDPDRLRGKLTCSQSGDLCVTSDGARLWACNKMETTAGEKKSGAWTPIGDCTSDSLVGGAQLEHCLGAAPKENSVCGDFDRSTGTHGGSCDQNGKICKSPDFLRAWRCDLNQGQEGGWLEVRNCSHDRLKDMNEYRSCKSYIHNLTKNTPVSLCSGPSTSPSGYLPCDRPNKLCFASKDRDKLLVCQ